MKIKETYGDQQHDIKGSSLEVLADDGRVLYTIDLNNDGSLEVHTSGTVKHSNQVLDTGIQVTAKGPNWFKLSREVFQ